MKYLKLLTYKEKRLIWLSVPEMHAEATGIISSLMRTRVITVVLKLLVRGTAHAAEQEPKRGQKVARLSFCDSPLVENQPGLCELHSGPS